jgi:hypothetical protein
MPVSVTASTAATLIPPSAVFDRLEAIARGEEGGSLLGVSAASAIVLNQIAWQLGQITAQVTIIANHFTKPGPFVLDQTSVAGLGTALTSAFATSVTARFDQLKAELDHGVAHLKQGQAQHQADIGHLRTTESTTRNEVQALAVHVGRAEEHARLLEKLREDVSQLFERECREAVGALAGDIERLACRVQALEHPGRPEPDGPGKGTKHGQARSGSAT